MDNIIEFLITIALLALFSVPSLLKKKMEAAKKRPVYTPDDSYEEEYDSGEFLRDSVHEIPKQEEYFTYETMEDNSWKEPEIKKSAPVSNSQQLDNKKEEDSLLSFEEEEVLKGVIYSEILDRKF